MFYSQFILAKKGPLGTIWIAAHLERKLRKNQVADTDIGVSVDSILSPDIPIALRLSSHLLLGVVRIYSRKVNYLFHDCSETLLKVKQAFRSTVVDLPPEESTAPYHSITLPETFDLDDFVLPDALNGNFVDHHISTREQITLQDSMDGTGHSTLQFGLDERFGDGDAPQIALDLDEEMLLDKGISDHNVSTPLALEEKMDIQMPGIPETPCAGMDIDDCQEVGTPRDMPPLQDPDTATGFSDLHGYNIQTQNLKDVYPSEDVGAPSAVLNDMEVCYPQNNGQHRDSLDHAEAPSTPGLAEEATTSRVHETHAISPQSKTSAPNIVDDFMSETKKAFQDPTDQDGAGTSLTKSCNELPSGAVVCDADVQNVLEAPGDKHFHNNATHNRSPDADTLAEDAKIERRTGELNSRLEMDKTGSLDPQYQNIVTEVNSCHGGHKTTLGFDSSLKPCTSQSDQFDIAPPVGQLSGENAPHPSVGEILSVDGVSGADNSSLKKQGEGLDSVMEPEMHHKSGHSPSANQADQGRQDEPSTIVSNDTQLGTLNFSASSEYPEPEKMLLAPDGYDMQNDLELGTSEKLTRESDERADGNKSLSGKKRHLERTPDLHSDSSVKVSGASRSKRRIDHIPNDDDLLASILVGRGASTLKMKSTPSLPTVPSSKRSRLMPNIGVPKRKVLLDDVMVLHADTIRQQLISTEDIRRTRRKAPCTRSDVWMIQKSFSEDEIFGESVLTGISAELIGLYHQTYELNEIEGYRDDTKNSFPDSSKSGLTTPKFVEKDSHGEQVYPSPLVSEKTDSPAPPSDSHPQIAMEHCETDENSHEHGHSHSNSKLLNDKPDSDPQIFTERCEIDGNSHEHDPLNSKLLNDKSNLLLDQSSHGEVAHHPGKDESSIFADDDHITKEDHTLTEGRNTCIINEASLISPQDFISEHHSVNGEAFSSADTSCVDVGREKLMEPMEDVGDANTCTPNFPVENSNCVDQSTITNDQVAVETQGQLEASVDQIGSSLCPPESSDVKTVMSPPELTCLEVPSLQNNADVQDLLSHPNTKDSDGYGSVTGGNVTDFLADDDADLDEEINCDVPNPEVQSLENSGWSVRTRGVARYLRLLFDNDSGFGKITVAMDRLLAGKTRKEASRMFFETLVLKSKDYVNVEQGTSFENINIKPTAKLLKSEF